MHTRNHQSFFFPTISISSSFCNLLGFNKSIDSNSIIDIYTSCMEYTALLHSLQCLKSLFYFVLLEQNPFLNDWIVFDKGDLVLRVGNILSCRVEKSGACRRQQLDRDRFALPPRHQCYRGMHHYKMYFRWMDIVCLGYNAFRL